MAFITLSGTLLDPNGDLAVGDQIRFTHKSTTGETVESAVSLITINPAGTYSLPLQYGLVLVEYKDVRKQQFKNLGVATVNQDNPATSIPELLNALVPVSSAELIEFQAILADCVAAQTAAENAATTAEAFAYQLTTTDLIARTATFAAETNIPTSGFTTSGDGGNGSWKQNGTTGQTPSKSPIQLDNASLFNDGNGNQWALVNDGTAPVEVSGGVSGGVADNALVFQAFLNSGVIGVLANNKTYAIGSRSSWTLDSTGFISTGKSKVLMLTGGFDQDTYAGYNSNSIGFYAEGFDNPIFKNIHIEFESHATIRTGTALAVRNCTNLDIDAEASGFSEPEFGVIAIDSAIGGKCFTNVHDCSTNDDTLPSMQITGLWVDGNRISSVYSKGVDFGNPDFKNLTFGAAALSKYSYQTDGLTLGGGTTSGGGGCKFGIISVENVYEGVDIQSSDHIISGIIAKNIALSPLKLVHAGRNNTINSVTANITGGPIVVFSGTDTSSEGADNNIVGSVFGASIGDLLGTGQPQCAIHFSGSAAAIKPNNNKVLSVNVVSSPNMINTVLDQAGENNKALDVSGIGSGGVGQVDSGQFSLEYVDIRKSPKSLISAYPNANLTGLVDGNTLIFNTATENNYSELNLTDGKFTSVAPVSGRLSAAIRTAALGAGEYIGIDVVAGGVVIATQKSWNDSVGNREATVGVTTNFKLNNRGVVMTVRLRTNAASLTITGNSELTSLNIEEI
jgi:hypothetical protein